MKDKAAMSVSEDRYIFFKIPLIKMLNFSLETKMAGRRKASDIWIKWTATLIGLDKRDCSRALISTNGGQYLPIRVNWNLQVEHNNVRAHKSSSNRCSAIGSRKKDKKLYAYKIPYQYILYPQYERLKPGGNL